MTRLCINYSLRECREFFFITWKVQISFASGTRTIITSMGLRETFLQPRNRRTQLTTLPTSSLPSTTEKGKNTRASTWEMYKPMLNLYSWDLPRVPSSFRSVSRCLLNRRILRSTQSATRRESLRASWGIILSSTTEKLTPALKVRLRPYKL